ncbi:hypothetical protein MUU53_22570 [Rhizobium lemnae]|uniref:Uncharacterized protein n=1 Tax=Rhizobium lemnae TaxID=1214924 RepID=A0ABV8E4Q2_9HYPH|nr:hypothetical protein [Rhizobium lemnae]MCJ8510642.1 hypothetical protein [Rhizobium lemnae]
MSDPFEFDAGLEDVRMFADIAAWFITLFLINPLQAEAQEQLQRANASAQTVQQFQQCVANEGPRLIERATNEPAWAIAAGTGIMIGWSSPLDYIDQSNENCASVVRLLQANGGSTVES